MRHYDVPMLLTVTGYVYFIQMDRIGPIKIGYSKDVKSRLFELQTANPYPLNLLVFFPANIEIERGIHSCYREMRLEGEWFLPHPIILKDIENIKEMNKRNGFATPDPKKDFGTEDERFKRLIGEPTFEPYELNVDAFCNECGHWVTKGITKIWTDTNHITDLWLCDACMDDHKKRSCAA